MKELFENAAYGMFSLMAELDKYQPNETRQIEISAEETPELLRAWLAELLYLFEVERILFVKFDVVEISEDRVSGVAKGMPFSDDIEWLGSILKAVTYHKLEVNRTPNRWEAQVVFDV